MLATLRHRDFGLFWLTGSTLATATAVAVSYLPGVLVGSIAGVFVNRWDRRRTMVGADESRSGGGCACSGGLPYA